VRLTLTVAALALTLTACGGAAHPAPTRTTGAAALGPTTSAAALGPTTSAALSPTSQASHASATDPVPSARPVAGWCDGTGYRLWRAVTEELTALQAGSNPGSPHLALDGRQLASDAGAAASYPPPGVSATAYVKGMEELVTSGHDDELGDVTRATTMAGEANAYLDNIDSFVDVKCP
jgi:hypothetical protein